MSSQFDMGEKTRSVALFRVGESQKKNYRIDLIRRLIFESE
jgi:hypothetical protein